MHNLEYINKVTFFSGLNETDLENIAKISVERKYKKNMLIFMEGEPGEAFYYIKTGKVKIFRTYEDGREHIINIFGEGDVLGEATLFNTLNYPASAEVYEDSVIGIIKNSELEALIQRNAELSLRLIKILAAKLVFAQQKIKDLTFNDVFARTAIQILNLSQDHGKKVEQGLLVDVTLNRQLLAEMIGTTRETVSRVISKFKKEKAIAECEDKIIILSEKKLRSWL